LPEAAYQQAVFLLKEQAADKHLATINKDKHELLVKGVPVSYQDDKDILQKKRLKVFDFDTPGNNHFLAVRQLEVVGKLYNCLAREFKRDYPILTSAQRLDAIARDLVWHFNERGYKGKAMFVAVDKPTAVRMYDLAMKYWPEYVAELKQRIADADDQQEELKLKHHLKRVEETEVFMAMFTSNWRRPIPSMARVVIEVNPGRVRPVMKKPVSWLKS
jgi:type I site-specific restriction-modification system R (restriction) subunit